MTIMHFHKDPELKPASRGAPEESGLYLNNFYPSKEVLCPDVFANALPQASGSPARPFSTLTKRPVTSLAP